MKKILLSVAVIGVASALAINATTALFTDVERSTGNTFMAGEIDLKIDNTSYYSNTPGLYNEGTSWLEPVDLIEGTHFFFKFDDVKPGDWGEDTISIHVKGNDSWLCADVTLTGDDDNGSTEPELKDEDPYTPDDGELAEAIEFIWWADDGDNVLEDDEMRLPSGPLGALEVGETATVALADSMYNIWGDDGPFPGDDTRYIGKAWCFGEVTLAPIEQDGFGFVGAVGENGPDERGTGFICDGSMEDNVTQTDIMTADISFRVEQSRNNMAFVCAIPETEPETGTITVVKEVINNNGGTLVVADFPLNIDGVPVTSGAPETFSPGTYNVGEDGQTGYEPTFSGACDASGNVILNAGDNLVCTITNDDIGPNITIIKNVATGDAYPDDFDLTLGGVPVVSGATNTRTAGVAYEIDETMVLGYRFVSITGVGCPTDLGETITLGLAESATCTITNELID